MESRNSGRGWSGLSSADAFPFVWMLLSSETYRGLRFDVVIVLSIISGLPLLVGSGGRNRSRHRDIRPGPSFRVSSCGRRS